jgi:hypothetical protein
MALQARELDRGEDHASWGHRPTYQVEFWRHLVPPKPEYEPEKYGYKKYAWVVTDAESFDEVSAWAAENASGRMVVIYLVLPEWLRPGHGRGLVHLSGLDPTNPLHRAHPSFPPEA